MKKNFLVIILFTAIAILAVIALLLYAGSLGGGPDGKEGENFDSVSTSPTPTPTENFLLTSSAFSSNDEIPSKYSCFGDGVNPPLIISGVPEGTKSLVLLVDDLDASFFLHWAVWNINPETKEIAENTAPSGAIQGRNSWGKPEYGAPCPPSGKHKYYFKLYALGISLELPANTSRGNLQQEIEPYIIGYTELVGRVTKR